MKYHLIGDQGISMRGIAEYLKEKDEEVSGSDLKTGGHKASNITPDIDLVIRSSAINPGSEGWAEVEEAQKLGIKVIKRSEFLGEITKDKKLIAISGMHGKTTITGMAGLLLIEAGLDPTVLIGERLREFGDDVLRIGKSDWFVMEACEYDRSFLDFHPEILILTNIEEEHLDTYPGGISEIKETFLQYLKNIKENGVIFACHDNENVREVIEKSIRQLADKAQIIYYGFSSPENNKLDYKIGLPGKHNVENALAVAALGQYLKIGPEKIKKVLQNFKGAKRRFEFKGVYNGADVIDDYGHHPTEIKATLEALGEKYPDKKKYVVFWPHQYKRIKPLLNEFSNAFSGADTIVVKPIYFVPGRDEKLDVTSSDLVKLIRNHGKNARVLETDKEIVEFLKKELDEKCVLLTIGIPPVYKIAEEIVE